MNNPGLSFIDHGSAGPKHHCESLLALSDIADVTNFVLAGTPLDEEASQRGTSVYLVERRIDMLPKPLTEGFLSPFRFH